MRVLKNLIVALWDIFTTQTWKDLQTRTLFAIVFVCPIR